MANIYSVLSDETLEKIAAGADPYKSMTDSELEAVAAIEEQQLAANPASMAIPASESPNAENPPIAGIGGNPASEPYNPNIVGGAVGKVQTLVTPEEAKAMPEMGAATKGALRVQEQGGPVAYDDDGSVVNWLGNLWNTIAYNSSGKVTAKSTNKHTQSILRGTVKKDGKEVPLAQLDDDELDYLVDSAGWNGWKGWLGSFVGNRADDGIMQQWDRTTGATIQDPVARKAARVKYAQDIARGMIEQQESEKLAAGVELENRPKQFGADVGAGFVETASYMLPYLIPHTRGVIAGIVEAGDRTNELLNDVYYVDENNTIRVKAQRDSTGAALAKGAARGAIAPLVEKFGGEIGAGMVGAIAKNTLGRIPLIKAASGKVVETAAGKAVSKWMNSMSRLGKYTGMQSMPVEMLEEFEDQVLDAGLGLNLREGEKEGTTGLSRAWGAAKEFFKPENLRELAESMVLIQVLGGGAAYMNDRRITKHLDSLIAKEAGITPEELSDYSLEDKQAAYQAFVEGLSEAEIARRFNRGAEAVNKLTNAIRGGKENLTTTQNKGVTTNETRTDETPAQPEQAAQSVESEGEAARPVETREAPAEVGGAVSEEDVNNGEKLSETDTQNPSKTVEAVNDGGETTQKLTKGAVEASTSASTVTETITPPTSAEGAEGGFDANGDTVDVLPTVDDDLPPSDDSESEVLPSFENPEEAKSKEVEPEEGLEEEELEVLPTTELPPDPNPTTTNRLKNAAGIDPTAVPTKKTKVDKLLAFPDSLEKYGEMTGRLLRVLDKGGVSPDSPKGKSIKAELARMDEAGWGEVYKAQMNWAGSPKKTRGEQPPRTPAEFAEWKKTKESSQTSENGSLSAPVGTATTTPPEPTTSVEPPQQAPTEVANDVVEPEPLPKTKLGRKTMTAAEKIEAQTKRNITKVKEIFDYLKANDPNATLDPYNFRYSQANTKGLSLKELRGIVDIATVDDFIEQGLTNEQAEELVRAIREAYIEQDMASPNATSKVENEGRITYVVGAMQALDKLRNKPNDINAMANAMRRLVDASEAALRKIEKSKGKLDKDIATENYNFWNGKYEWVLDKFNSLTPSEQNKVIKRIKSIQTKQDAADNKNTISVDNGEKGSIDIADDEASEQVYDEVAREFGEEVSNEVFEEFEPINTNDGNKTDVDNLSNEDAKSGRSVAKVERGEHYTRVDKVDGDNITVTTTDLRGKNPHTMVLTRAQWEAAASLDMDKSENPDLDPKNPQVGDMVRLSNQVNTESQEERDRRFAEDKNYQAWLKKQNANDADGMREKYEQESAKIAAGIGRNFIGGMKVKTVDREYIEGEDGNADERQSIGGALASSAVDEYNEVVRRYTNPDGTKKRGWMKAPNGEPTKLTERQWVQVRTPSFKKWFGDWENVELQNWLENSSVATATGKEYADIPKAELEDSIVSYFADKGIRSVENENVGKVNITRSGIHDSIAKGVGRMKIAAFNHLPEIISNGRVVAQETNWKERGYNTVTLAAPIEIGNKKHVALVTIRQYPNHDNNFYLHEVGLLDEIKREAERLYDTGLSQNGDKSARPLGSMRNIAQSLFAVNPSSVSKVVDENGEPLVVYHGTKRQFTKFAPLSHFGGNIEQSLDRLGFYHDQEDFNEVSLEELESRAKGDGAQIMRGFLNIKNHLIIDVDLGSWEVKEFEKRGLSLDGHDGVVYDNWHEGRDGEINPAYIIMSPTQIKSATDNTGAFDGGNPNIRDLRDPKTKKVVGTWNRKTNELTLFRGANASTLVHELGGHAAYQFAQEQAAQGDKTLLNKMNECINYALTNPKMKPLIEDIRSRYPEASEGVMRDEIFAALMERNSPIMQDLTKTLQGKAWYNRTWQAIKDAFRAMLTKMGFNKADLRGIDKMQPEEFMSWLDRTMADGKNLGALAGMDLGDGESVQRKLSIASTLKTGRESTAEYKDSHGKRRILHAVIGDDGFGRTKIARKHCVDFGTATTGGFSLDEIERYEDDILAYGRKTFDKDTGRRTITWKSPEGVTFKVGTFLQGRGNKAREVINTVHTDRNAKETRALTKKISAAKDLLQRQSLSPQGSTIPAGTTEALKSSSEPTGGSIPQPSAENNGELRKNTTTTTATSFMDDKRSRSEILEEKLVDSTAPIKSVQTEIDNHARANGEEGVEEVVNADGSTDWRNSTDFVAAKDKENGHLERNIRELKSRYIDPAMEALAKAIRPNQDKADLITDFNLYLQCKHAAARNRKIANDRGDTYTADYSEGMGMVTLPDGRRVGLSENVANQLLATMERKYGAKFSNFDDAAQSVYKMLEADLYNRYQAGLLSAEDWVKYMERRQGIMDWGTYIPLKDDLQNTEAEAYKAVSFSPALKRNEFMKAKGRGENDIADSPFAAAVLQAEQGIRRSSRNVLANVEANLASKMNGGFAKNGMTDFSVTELTSQGEPVYAEVVAGVDARRTGTEFEFTFADGDRAIASAGASVVANRPDIHLFKRDGKLYAIRYPAGANGRGIAVAKAFSGENMGNWGEGMSWVPKVTHWLSSMRTQYSPEFTVSNMLSDNLEALQALVGRYGLWDGGKAFGKALQYQWKNRKDLWHYVRTGEARGLVKNAIDAGILTKGGVVSQGIDAETKELTADLDKFIRKQKRLGEMNATDMAKSFGRNVVDYISMANSFAEYSTRIGIASALEEYGVPRKDAIKFARDATVNFNRKGTAMPYINGLYMFANAAVQGAMRSVQSFRDDFSDSRNPTSGGLGGNRKMKGELVGMLVAIGVAKAIIDNALGDDDEREKEGGRNARNLSEYDRKHNVGLPVGGGRQIVPLRFRGPYAAIPYLAQTFTRYAMGDIDAGDVGVILASELGAQTTELIGGNGVTNDRGEYDTSLFMQSIAPTLVDPFVQMGTGKDYKGDNRLRKKFDDTMPDSSNGKRNTLGLYKGIAQVLNYITGGNENRIGKFDAAPENVQLLVEFIGGAPLRDINNVVSSVMNAAQYASGGTPEKPLSQIPFVRRFVREYPDVTGRYYDAIEMYERDKAEYKKATRLEDRRELRKGKPYLSAGKTGLDDLIERVKELTHLERGEVKRGRKWVEPKVERSEEQKEKFRKQRLKLQATILRRLGE